MKVVTELNFTQVVISHEKYESSLKIEFYKSGHFI